LAPRKISPTRAKRSGESVARKRALVVLVFCAKILLLGQLFYRFCRGLGASTSRIPAPAMRAITAFKAGKWVQPSTRHSGRVLKPMMGSR